MEIKLDQLIKGTYRDYANQKPQAIKNFIGAIETQCNRLKRVKGNEKKDVFVMATNNIITEAYADLLTDFEQYACRIFPHRGKVDQDMLKNNLKTLIEFELEAVTNFWPYIREKAVMMCIDHLAKDFYGNFASHVIKQCKFIIEEFKNKYEEKNI